MRRFLAILLACLPAPALADLSQDIGQRGLAAVGAELSALPERTDDQRFALGAVMFLSAIEGALQLRYRHGISRSFSMMIPVMRLPIPENPNPLPVEPDVVTRLFMAVSANMDRARQELAAIPEGSAMSVRIALSDLWFDIDANGQRSKGESLHEVAGPLLFSRTAFDPTLIDTLSIQFDVADSRWLSAYAALLGAFSDVIVAYDPTQAMADVLTANAQREELNRDLVMPHAMDMMGGGFVDALAVIERTLRHQPDAQRMAQAHAKALAMVADNRAFWRLMRAETDDQSEWIANERQHSALGLDLPPGTGDIWLSVLSDTELMLQGKLLIPYWRLGDGAGLNLQRMFLEPSPIDVIAWAQGIAAMPYAERGPRVTADNWRRFDQMVSGQSILFAAFLN